MYRYLTALLALILTLPLTADKAYLVKDIDQNLAPQSSSPGHFLTTGGFAYFSTTDSAGNPLQLWRSDGTAAGTIKLGSGGYSKVVWNGKVWFLDAAVSSRIWSTDGTVAGTQSLTLPAQVTAYHLMAGTNHIYFYNGSRLWRSDGTSASTVEVSTIDFQPPNSVSDAWPFEALAGQALLFASNANNTGYKLWRVDDSGVSLVADPGNDYFMSFLTVGSLVYLQKISGRGAYSELWRSDGTVAGTFALKPVGFIGPTNLIVDGSLVTFLGNDGTGFKVWRTDGTVAGTVVLESTLPPVLQEGFDVGLLGRLNNGTIILTGPPFPDEGHSPTHWGIWTFDGSTTSFLTNVSVGSGGGVAGGAYAVLQFGATLWRTDGTMAGTYSLGDVMGSDGAMGMLNGNILFAGTDAQHGTELWKTDGTLANTGLLKDIVATTYGSAPAMFRGLNGGVLFTANANYPSGTRDLWFSRGTDATTQLVLSGVADALEIVTCGSRAFFSHGTTGTGVELWSTDGTAAGTAMVKDILPGTDGSDPTNLTCVDDRLLFYVWSSNGTSVALWRSDGTAAGTLPIQSLDRNNLSSLRGAGHYGWFVSGSQFWRTDGTPGGTVAIDLAGATSPAGFIQSGQNVFFSTYGSPASHLWKSDGTQAGTTSFFSASFLTTYADFYGKLAFLASPNLCTTDGTAAPPVCFDQLVSSGSWTFAMVPLNGRLYYNFPDLRSTDGVTSSSAAVGDIRNFISAASGRLYAIEDSYGFPLIETDGSPSGTQTILTSGATDAAANGGRLYIGAEELYAYDLPVTSTSFAPMNVDTAGGETVTITGRGFKSPATVTVGGTLAVSNFISPTIITFITPPFPAGPHPVELAFDGRRFYLDEPLHYGCPAFVASISTPDAFVQTSTPVQLHGGGGTRCAWFPAAGLDNPSICTPTATVATSTTYTLVVFNDSGCSSTNDPSVRIHVVPPVPAGLAATAVTSTSVHLVWNASAGATQYDVARMTIGEPLHVVATVSTTNYTDSSAAAGQVYVYSVRATGSDGPSAYGAPDIATTVAFTDAALLGGVTPIRAIHIVELRAAVNVARALASLPAATWTDPTITTNVTPIRAVHFLELRAAITGALNALGVALPLFSTPPAQGGAILASYLQELRAALQ